MTRQKEKDGTEGRAYGGSDGGERLSYSLKRSVAKRMGETKAKRDYIWMYIWMYICMDRYAYIHTYICVYIHTITKKFLLCVRSILGKWVEGARGRCRQKHHGSCLFFFRFLLGHLVNFCAHLLCWGVRFIFLMQAHPQPFPSSFRFFFLHSLSRAVKSSE